MMFTYTQSLTSHFNMLSSTFQTFNRALGDAHDLTLVLGEPLTPAGLVGSILVIGAALAGETWARTPEDVLADEIAEA